MMKTVVTTLRALTVDDALIYIRTKEASAAHLDFLAFSQADAHDRFQVDDIKTLLRHRRHLSPL
ncbi:hypothetical protein ACFPCW_18820 [Vibrio thalassae]|uniref:hypothetical protein n=1 Tax=Vibrio thalassae TaxID=1243014 RepID=UPI003619F7B8